jgi:GMP synthase (glutamine-hydrolysing)
MSTDIHAPDPDPRLRLAVHAADRAARARGGRLQRDRAWDCPAAIRAFAPAGIILSGGPESVTIARARAPRRPMVFELGVPVLGICYGMQTMARSWAARSRPRTASSATRRSRSRLLEPAGRHRGPRDEPTARPAGCLDEPRRPGRDLPPGFIAIAGTDSAPLAGMADDGRRFYGLQFHPEVTHTRQGRASSSASCTTSAAAPATGRRQHRPRQHQRSAARSATTRCCSAVRRRRFLRGGGAAAPGDRRPARLRLRRSRPAAPTRATR